MCFKRFSNYSIIHTPGCDALEDAATDIAELALSMMSLSADIVSSSTSFSSFSITRLCSDATDSVGSECRSTSSSSPAALSVCEASKTTSVAADSAVEDDAKACSSSLDPEIQCNELNETSKMQG